MAVGCGLRLNDILRSDTSTIWRVLAEAVQRGQVVRRHWLGVGLQKGCAGHCHSNASTYVRVSTSPVNGTNG